MTINQWNLVHGNRSIRAGTRLRTTPGVSAVADDIGTLLTFVVVAVPAQLPQHGWIHVHQSSVRELFVQSGRLPANPSRRSRAGASGGTGTSSPKKPPSSSPR